MARWWGNAPLVERHSYAVQRRYAGRPKLCDKGGEPGRPHFRTRLANLHAGLDSGRGEAVRMLRHELPTFRAAALSGRRGAYRAGAAPRAPGDLATVQTFT